jgi:hypothetical protein
MASVCFTRCERVVVNMSFVWWELWFLEVYNEGTC